MPFECEAAVSEPPHYIHEHPCTRSGAVTVYHHGAEHWVCRQHAKAFNRNPNGCAFTWGWER